MTTKAKGNEDPNYTVILVAENGKIYRLTRETWEIESNLLADAGGQGIIKQLTEFGAYLSFVPPEIAVGIGEVCTVVNLQALLKNNVSTKASSEAHKHKASG
jgi:hypothetical protein